MFKGVLIILFCFGVIFSGCGNNEQEQQLEQRESALLQKEKEFALKDAEYQSLKKMRDSLIALKQDTVEHQQWPPLVAGVWNSRVICTESNCNDYVVGDVRSDQWDFAYDSIRLIARVMNNNNKLVRVYNGTYTDSIIHLSFLTDSLSDKQVVMNVSLPDIAPDKIKGIGTVTVNNKCTAKFSVELIKNKSIPE